MKKNLLKLMSYIFMLSLSPFLLDGYNLPPVNLGLSSFLDGGVEPLKPGIILQGYLQYYEANKFENIGNNKSPHFEVLTAFTQILYTTHFTFLGAKTGFDFFLPWVPYSHISQNNLGLKDSGAGFGDLDVGYYLQWDPIKKGDRLLFSHRIEVQWSLPTGKCYQKETGCFEQMARAGHKICYYKGSTHISFMDHGYVNPKQHADLKEEYFNGTFEERKAFFETVRKDVRFFLKENGI